MNQFLETPSTNFAKVRDGRASMPLWIDVDLTVARSIAGSGANAALTLNLAGNSFYIDQDTANVGTATVHFQDTNLGASSAPLFVSAGFIANVPFTQILIENLAQAGKRLRIFYGVDIDFQAGINASIAISGSVSVLNNPEIVNYGASYKSVTPLAANTPDTVFTAAANVNGAIIWDARFISRSNATVTPAFLAKASAPANNTDGDAILYPDIYNISVDNLMGGKLTSPIKIPAGKGLYYINGTAETVAQRSVLYTLL